MTELLQRPSLAWQCRHRPHRWICAGLMDREFEEGKDMADIAMIPGPEADKGPEDAWTFRLIFIASYGLFLVTVLATRLFRRNASVYSSVDSERRSVFGEAKAMAYTVIPFAFMSW